MSENNIAIRAAAWLAGDDTGSSSKAICKHMLGLPDARASHPHDPADLGRCLRLLAQFPLWRLRIGEMAELNAYWAALVSRWPELESAMEQEVGIDWSRGRSAPKTHALMRTILDPIQEADNKVFRFGGVTVTVQP